MKTKTILRLVFISLAIISIIAALEENGWASNSVTEKAGGSIIAPEAFDNHGQSLDVNTSSTLQELNDIRSILNTNAINECRGDLNFDSLVNQRMGNYLREIMDKRIVQPVTRVLQILMMTET